MTPKSLATEASMSLLNLQQGVSGAEASQTVRRALALHPFATRAPLVRRIWVLATRELVLVAELPRSTPASLNLLQDRMEQLTRPRLSTPVGCPLLSLILFADMLAQTRVPLMTLTKSRSQKGNNWTLSTNKESGGRRGNLMAPLEVSIPSPPELRTSLNPMSAVAPSNYLQLL